MAESTVRLKGYKEYLRALRRIDGDVNTVVRTALKTAAEPVASDARNRLAKYPGIKLATIGPRVTLGGVAVTQRAKKVTGNRPDFGAVQMTVGLIPALDENADEIEADVNAAVGLLIKSAGFH